MSQGVHASTSMQDVYQIQHYRTLVGVLWDWTVCKGCEGKTTCQSGTCPAPRFKRLEPFFRYVQDSAAYLEIDTSDAAVSPTLDDAFRILRQLKADPDITIDQLVPAIVTQGSGIIDPVADRQENATRLATRMLLMTDCGPYDFSEFDFDQESGLLPRSWRSEDETLAGLFSLQHSKSDHPVFACEDARVVVSAAHRVKASHLQRRAHLKF